MLLFIDGYIFHFIDYVLLILRQELILSCLHLYCGASLPIPEKTSFLFVFCRRLASNLGPQRSRDEHIFPLRGTKVNTTKCCW